MNDAGRLPNALQADDPSPRSHAPAWERTSRRSASRRAHRRAVKRAFPRSGVGTRSHPTNLRLPARFKVVRESQGRTLAEVAERMGIDPPALSRSETGKMLNPTLATLHKWAEALVKRPIEKV